MENLSSDNFTFSSMSESSDISDMSDCQSVQSDISDMDISDIHSNTLIKGGSEEEEDAEEAKIDNIKDDVQDKDAAEEVEKERIELNKINSEFLKCLNNSVFEINFRKKLIEKKNEADLDVFIKENIYELIAWYDVIIKKNKSFFDIAGNKKKYSIILCTNINNYLRIGLLCNDVDDNYLPKEGKAGEYITAIGLQKTLDDFAIEQTKKANDNKEYLPLNGISDGELVANGLTNVTDYIINTTTTLAVNTTRMIEVKEVDRSIMYRKGLAIYTIKYELIQDK